MQALKDRLHQHRRQPSDSLPSFIPLEELSIKASTIENVLTEIGRSSETIAQQATYIYSSALKLFSIFLYIDQEQKISSIVPAGWSDTDLPVFFDEAGEYKGPDCGNTLRSCIEGWDSLVRSAFDTCQWLFLAPRFHTLGQHLDLHDRCPLPFQEQHVKVELPPWKTLYVVKIHRSYQDLYRSNEANEPRIALKRFSRSLYKNFDRERTMLNQLRCLNDQRICSLLATYQFLGEHYILMPLGTCNLFEFWTRKDPRTDFEDNMRFFVHEITGLTRSLSRMHSMSTQQFCLSHEDSLSSINLRKGIIHGDIKPKNIILQPANRIESPHFSRPMLTFIDFGLSDYATEPMYPFVTCTRTYQAPETELYQTQSPKSDVWSLACVILDFLTWLLLGSEGVERFGDERVMATLGSGSSVQDDLFFALGYMDGQMVDARIRDAVVMWVQILYAHELCACALKGVLDIVVADMLVVEQDKRADSAKVFARLSLIENMLTFT